MINLSIKKNIYKIVGDHNQQTKKNLNIHQFSELFGEILIFQVYKRNTLNSLFFYYF